MRSADGGQSEPVATASGFKSGRAEASDVPKLSSPFAEPSAATRETGNPTSTGSCALFPSTINTIRSATISATSSAVSNRQLLSERCDRDYRRWPLARRRLAQLAAYSDRAHPTRLRLRSLDGDRILFGRPPEPGSQRARIGDRARLRIRRSPRLRPADHAALHPLVALQSARRQRPLPGLSRRSDRPAQPDRSRQRTAPGRQRLRTGAAPMVLERCGATPNSPLVASQ